MNYNRSDIEKQMVEVQSNNVKNYRMINGLHLLKKKRKLDLVFILSINNN